MVFVFANVVFQHARPFVLGSELGASHILFDTPSIPSSSLIVSREGQSDTVLTLDFHLQHDSKLKHRPVFFPSEKVAMEHSVRTESLCLSSSETSAQRAKTVLHLL